MTKPKAMTDNAPPMFSRVIESLFVIAVAVWVGAIVLLSFVVAPGIFAALPRPQAGDLMNQLFPAYYRVGVLCSLVALITGGVQAYLGRRWGTVRFWLTGVMAISTLYAGFVVTPHAQAIRAQLMAGGDHPPQMESRVKLQEAFRLDHQRAVAANGVALISGLGVLWMVGVAERRLGDGRPGKERVSSGAGR